MSFMNSLGIDSAAAATVFTVIAPASLVGTFLAGVLVDRIAGRYLRAVAQACLAGAMLWAISIAQPWQAFVYGGILGFTSGFSPSSGRTISGGGTSEASGARRRSA